MDLWPEWEDKLNKFAKHEEPSRPAIKAILSQLQTDDSDVIAFPAGNGK